MPSPPVRNMRLITAILALGAICACAQAVQVSASESTRSSSTKNEQCLSNAYIAAERSYKQHFRGDWYIGLEAIVEDGRVALVTVNVGPYDGTAGGGIIARFECSLGRLVTVEYER